MTVLVVGLSHRTAPVSVLERAAVPVDDVRKTLEELYRAETISEVLLLSTCNRIEVYADVARFHPSMSTSPRPPRSTCSRWRPAWTRW